MSILRRIVATVSGTVRYKLLVLVLFPILLVVPIALAIAVYWGHRFTYEQLYIKVNTDLSVTHDVFIRLQADYLDRLGRLAESYRFRTSIDGKNVGALDEQLITLKSEAGFSYLHFVDLDGYNLDQTVLPPGKHKSRLSPALIAARLGQANVNIEIFSSLELQQQSEKIAENVRLSLLETLRAHPTDRVTEDRGMMIRAVYPVKNSQGELSGILDGGILLNGHFGFVDKIRDLVYGPGNLPEGSIGTVTVFLDDVRISTNVPLGPGERALGTRVSDEVRTKVLDQGKVWVDRAFVVNDWYISAYEPIVDARGERVGMLYAGYLEAPYRESMQGALYLLILMFVVLAALSAIVAVLGAKTIFKPLEAMSRVVHATRSGEDQRVGAVASQDEIGELARAFDGMLDRLKQHTEELQQWADQLEDKVGERTAELASKNTDLQRTIRVLRETRQQLVHAEKLAALGELTAGVAHEINNPMAVMLGNLDVLASELGPAIAPVKDEMDLVVEQIYRIKDIINSLLQYARPDEYAGYLTEVNVNEVIQHTLKLVKHVRRQTAFTFKLDATRRVTINQQELQQVMVNIVVNAIHALPESGGQVTLQSRDWEDKGVVICVQDNGCGMDDDEIGKVFNPFYSTKEEGEGTGLGLSVSYGLVRRYGGNITVESVQGEGSRFFVWLLSEPVMKGDEQAIIEQLQAIEDDGRLS